jgi:hypothetical protein
MGEKLNVEDAEGIEENTKTQAINTKAAADNVVTANEAAVKLTGGDRPVDEVIAKSQGDLIKIKKIINEGGFSGAERDKYLMSLHHAEWVQSRIVYSDCDRDIDKKSIEYTALVKGKAQTHEIIKAHQEWVDTRNKCKESSSNLMNKATQYIETDRRVRANKLAEGDIYPPVGSGQQGFQVKREGFIVDSNDIKEGFNFYEDTTKFIGNPTIGVVPNQTSKFNVRLPLLSDTGSLRTTDLNNTILPWVEYYVTCDNQGDATAIEKCNVAMTKKNYYISAINKQFDRANILLNTYYNVSNKNNNQSNLTLLEEKDIQSILENQKKNIALIKQNALYDYDEYNSLAFYEDLVLFLYYAVFSIFVFMSIREFYSVSSYDKRNIVILILLGTYPKYILQVVLWILNGLTKITEMLGLKNVQFWK